jgi:cell surface protein SprA
MASHDSEVARKADTIMAQADKDGDGVITFDEFVIVSKKFPNILFPFQGKRLNSELQLRTDVSVRQNQTWVHRLSTEETQITAGSQVLTVRFNADYAISQTVYFILFFEHIWNKPSTSTSYNSHNTKGGITMRLSFN